MEDVFDQGGDLLALLKVDHNPFFVEIIRHPLVGESKIGEDESNVWYAGKDSERR